MPYRALALDVDGTLICAGQKQIAPQTTAALKALQTRGVMVALTTGRSAFASDGSTLGTDFMPDWRVCANGAQILDAAGNILHEKRIKAGDVERITAFAEQNELPLTFTFDDAYYIYNQYAAYVAYYTAHAGEVPYLRDGTDRCRHRQSLPFGAYIIMPRKFHGELARLCPGIKLMEAALGSYDISPSDADKKHGVGWMLSRLGIGFNELVAVGDSENDAELLCAAGLGVAMGNAPAHIKTLADHVTDSVQENGVLAVIERFFGGDC